MYDAANDRWQLMGAARGLAPTGAHKNLTIACYAAASMTIHAEEVVLRNAAGTPYLATQFNLVVDITVTGAGGLAVGAEAASTWYYVWLIYNPSSNTVSAVLSVSYTATTLPAGYTYSALIGAVYNDASANLRLSHQSGREVWMVPFNIFVGKAAAAGSTWEQLAGADLTAQHAAFPEFLVKKIRGLVATTSSTNGLSVALSTGAPSQIGMVSMVAPSAAALMTFGGYGSMPWEMVWPYTAQGNTGLWWMASDTAAKNTLQITGFTI